MLSVDNISRNL